VKDILDGAGDLLNIDIKGELFGDIGQEFKNLKTNLEDTLDNITNSPLLDAAHNLNKTLNIVGADLGIPPLLSKSVINTLRDGGVSATVSLVGGRSPLPLAQLESKIGEFSNTITNIKQLIEDPVSVTSNTAPLSVASLKDEWKRGVFRYVKSSSELKGDFVSSTRDIDSVVIHWSETYLDQDIGAKELNSINNGGIPYHYVIRRDGSLQRGRDVNQVGAHTESSTDATSIGVILIAGYPTYLGDESVGLSGDSIAIEQTRTLETLMGVFYESFPGAEAFGHGELGGVASAYEPGFDVKEFALSKFGKTRSNTNTTVAAPRIENTPVAKPSSTAGGSGKIIELYLRNGSVRDDPIQPELKNILELTAQETNTTFLITSGGQLPDDPVNVPGGRKGGPRHNYGWAADLLAKDANGNWLDFGTDNPSTKVLQIYNTLVANGATGIGAGPGYMFSKEQGVHAIHVDIAAGRSTSAAPGGRWGKSLKRASSADYIV